MTPLNHSVDVEWSKSCPKMLQTSLQKTNNNSLEDAIKFKWMGLMHCKLNFLKLSVFYGYYWCTYVVQCGCKRENSTSKTQYSIHLYIKTLQFKITKYLTSCTTSTNTIISIVSEVFQATIRDIDDYWQWSGSSVWHSQIWHSPVWFLLEYYLIIIIICNILIWI